MRVQFVNILKYSTIMLIIISIFVTGYIFYIALQIPLKKMSDVDNSLNESKSSDISEIILEEGALINIDELKSFFLFSDRNDDFVTWKYDKFEKGEFEQINSNSSLVSINKQQTIKTLLENDCSVIYCYQNKINFDNIPSIFWKGLIGIEDYRFLNHFGIDLKSIARAIVTDLIEMRLVQGGSTLTQQLVKNLFLTNEKTLSRKLREVIYSVYIELKFSKEEILEAYFNNVFWGSLQGIRIRGIYAASLFYFDRHPDLITPQQASILISLLKGPGYYHPIRHLDRLKKRTTSVFKKLVSLSFFSKKTKMWSDQDWTKWQKKLQAKEKKRHYHSIWATLNVKNKLLNPYEKFIFQISTRKVLKQMRKKVGAEKDISIKAYIGNPFSKERENDFKFYSKVERNREIAITDEKHQIGSIIKPLLYGIFTKNGKSMNDTVSTDKITLKLLSGVWSPREAHKPRHKKITLLDALLKSYNRPVIRIAREIGFELIEKELIEYIPELKQPLAEYPAQLLGAVELGLQKIFLLYSKFINEECRQVTNFNESSSQEDLFKSNLLYMLSDPKITTVKRIVGEHMKNMRFFGKTGTSNNGYNNWYIFFDGRRLGVIWAGLEGRRDGKHLALYGGSTSFRIYQYFSRNSGKRFNELSCDNYLEHDLQNKM